MKMYKQLSELGGIVTGKTPSTTNNELWGGTIPFITPTDIEGYDTYYQESTERTVSAYGASRQQKTLLPPNTVCVTCIGSTIGKPCITKSASITNQQINTIIPNKDNDYRYIYYLIREALPYFQLIGGGSGSGTPIISKNKFAKLKFPIEPNLQKQRKIASILSAYDSLIENNTKRIRLLEQMAENLYKEWFVRFRFPGYENTEFVGSKLGRLPATFQVTNMNSIFEYYIGGGWGNDDYSEDYPIEARVIRGADFPSVWRYDLSSCPRRYHKISNYKSRQLVEGDIVMEISGGTSEQPVGRTVLVTQEMIDRFKDGKVICASFCKLIRLNKAVASPYFFYYWMQYLYCTRIIDRFQLQSTGIINFKFEAFLRKGLVMLPPMDIMNIFESQIIPIIKEINKLAMQNENLIKQRDALLPRLMSGKLEVKTKFGRREQDNRHREWYCCGYEF
ncbi:MAG: restriction endonuclease subunit S [Paraprevotella sp.]|nr:restriction endonuclease subunit S [Paraprevotella sp.]